MLHCSIGIMAYNEEQNIARLLLALQKQRLEKVFIENIIVVASGCTDNTENIVKKFARNDPKITLIVQKKREGKSSAINLWIKNAKAEILVLESGDTVPEEDTLEKLVSPFEDTSIGMTGARPVPVNDPGSFIGFAVHRLWRLHHLIALTKPKMGEMVAFRNVVGEIPSDSAVDEDSIEAEILRKGYRTIYCPEAVVRNKGPENFADFIRQRRRIYTGHLWLKKKFGHGVSTLSGLKAFKFLLDDFSWNFPNIFYTPGVIFMEVWGRILGWYDFYIKKDNPKIWDIAASTKNLSIIEKTDD
jgi:cellulose synthase/poly-beta-1,6-N-acetylglucosamine synthase-like glycosyltransferase